MPRQIFDYRNVAADAPPTHWSNTLVRSKSCSRLSNIELDKEFATILVGDREVVFNVRRALVSKTSDFFKHALEGDFVERRGLVRLMDGDPHTFSIYISWLTTEKLAVGDIQQTYGRSMNLLTDILVLADLIQDDAFYNSAVDCIIDDIITSQLYPTGMVAIFSSRLPESSPIIKLLVDIWAYTSRLGWWDETNGDAHDAPMEFWRAVAKEMRKSQLVPEPLVDHPWMARYNLSKNITKIKRPVVIGIMECVSAQSVSKSIRGLRAKEGELMNLRGQTVVVIVGGWPAKFLVHANLVAASSVHFKDKIEEGGHSPFGAVIKLSGIYDTTFEVYLSWLYARVICTDRSRSWRKHKGEQDELVDCIKLALMIKDDSFYNAVVDCVIEGIKEEKVAPMSMAAAVFNEMFDSPIQQLFIDLWVYAGKPNWKDRTFARELPMSFWKRVADGFLHKATTRQAPWKVDSCRYHIHSGQGRDTDDNDRNQSSGW